MDFINAPINTPKFVFLDLGQPQESIGVEQRPNVTLGRWTDPTIVGPRQPRMRLTANLRIDGASRPFPFGARTDHQNHADLVIDGHDLPVGWEVMEDHRRERTHLMLCRRLFLSASSHHQCSSLASGYSERKSRNTTKKSAA